MASINEHLDKISVKDDSRIRRESATINGKTYGYLIAEPEAGFTRTLFLIHGFPDLSMAWRYQIPHFLKLGFRVVCPDCIGYGRSDAPTGSIEPYTFKSHAVDFHELCKSLGCETVVVGAHDWGCAIAYRFALEFPSFVTHLFTCAVPYLPTSEKYIPLEVITKFLPSLGYQLQFGSEDGIIESHTQDKTGIRNYLNALYGGRTSDGKAAMTAEKGVELDLMPNLSRSVLISEEELEYYVEEYSRHGLRGPCNYYRNRKANWEADSPLLAIENGVKIKCPTLFVRALGDSIVTDEIASKMAANVPDYATKNVNASHWLLWQKPEEVNAIVTEWMQGQGLVAASK